MENHQMENKAVTHIFNDILRKVLELSEKPGQFGEYLTGQIRELVGARTIVIAVKTETGLTKIFSVFPSRRTEWANQRAVMQLADLSFEYNTTQYLDKDYSAGNASLILKQLEIDKAIAFPLIAANRKVGSILLLDIMDLYGTDSVINLLNQLSGVFALVIRNSYLYQNMEDLVISRTEELQKRNDELEKAIQRADQSELQAREILQTAMDGFWMNDLKGRFVDVNDIACKMLGYSREEMLRMSIADIGYLETADLVNARIERIVKDGENQYESKHRCKDGSIIDVEVSAKLQASGQFMVTFIHDISKRKRAEDALRQSEDRWRRAISDSPVPIMIHDENDKVLQLSAGWTKYSGYTIEDIPTLADWTERAYGERSGLKKEYIDHLFNINETENNGEWFVTAKDGSKRIWDFQTTPLGRIQQGARVLHSMAVDITDRKVAEKQLSQEKQILANVIEGTNLGTWNWNLQNGVVIVNERWAEIMGYTLEELQPIDINTWISHVHPDDLPIAYEALNKHFHHESEFYDVEFRQPHKNGTWVWVHARGKVLQWTDEGTPLIMSGTHLDSTKRKRDEYELIKAKEQAEESDRLKSAFLANMSHEIRTPMNGILGFAELLKEPGLTGEQQQQYIRIIEKSGTRMLNIINDIVDISKIESGQMKLFVSPTNVNDQMDFLHKFFITEAEHKGIRLLLKSLLPAHDATIYSDREKLYAILSNLIKNAIKYTDFGNIEFGCVLKNTFKGQHNLEFYVKDTGIGIPKNRLEAIFERFIQADIVDKKARQGAGLGLTISKAYVEMQGGKIWVESLVGKGSTFYFTLPYQANISSDFEDENKDNTDLETSFSFPGLKILVVEDDEFSKSLISIEVKKYASEVVSVQTGKEAVKACRENPDLDLVFMDIMMPEMDGYEATRLIREFNKEVVIIAQTAYALSGDREMALAAGCTDYLSKPIKREKIDAIIHKYFE